MSKNETTDDTIIDPTEGLACTISFSIEALVRAGKIEPDEAIRAVASALWATVVAYSAPEHFEANSAFAVEAFETCKDAATQARMELEFDEKHQGDQWGTA